VKLVVNCECFGLNSHTTPLLHKTCVILLPVHAVDVFVENPWPPVVPHMREVKGSLVNVLLEAAKKDYRYKRTDVSSRNIRDTTACKDANETLNSNID